MSEENGRKRIKIRLLVIVAVVLLAAMAALRFLPDISKSKEPEIITKATLEKIINVSDLSTFEAVYNGVAEVTNENDPEKIDYYVSYEAKVKAGFDFEQMGVEVDHEQKIITVDIPEIKITDVNVDIASLDYIFINDRANTDTVSEQAYKKCIEDVKMESSSEKSIYELAEQNARNVVKALVNPFVEQLDEKYKLVVNVNGVAGHEENN